MSLTAKKHADEIREMWQSRALRESTGKLRQVLIVAFAKEYPGALLTLLKVTFPGFVDIDRPMFVSYAHVELDGCIMCDSVSRSGARGWVKVFGKEEHFIYAMRSLADKLKLDDKDRSEMFVVLQKWVASDRRVGHLGQRLAS